MVKKNKIKWVYCPKCGEVSDAALLYCQKCKESLKGAAELDSSEEKIKKRRIRALERDKKRKAAKEKREAVFARFPILRPLYYIFWVCLAICIPVAVVFLYKFSPLAGSTLLAVAFIRFYIWYAPLIVDNIDAFDYYADGSPFPYRTIAHIHRTLWGCIILGFFIIISLLEWVYSCLPF